jgi:hypothetical protein
MATAIAIAPTLNLPTGADSTLALMPHLLRQRGEIVRPCGAEVGGRDYLIRVPAITWPAFCLYPAA